MTGKEVRFEKGKYYTESFYVGTKLFYKRFHNLLERDENYKKRLVFYTEQFTLYTNGELDYATRAKLEINTLSRKVYEEIQEGVFNSEKMKLFQEFINRENNK